MQKATALGANIKYKKKALRCSGHHGQQHSHLQGKASNGLNKTAMAAVYPRTMCNRMKSDMVDFLERRGLLRLKVWPDMVWFTFTHLYECIRCQLGRVQTWKMGTRHQSSTDCCRRQEESGGTMEEGSRQGRAGPDRAREQDGDRVQCSRLSLHH